jgi:uncharacterized protein YkwD
MSLPRLPFLVCVAAAASACTTYRNLPDPAGAPPSSRATDSLFSLREEQLANLLTRDRGQQRPRLVWNPILARVARERAWDMARRGYFAHVNPEGLGANTLVTRAGYVLPDNYDHSLAGNNIESAAEGYASAEAVWRHWMGSPHHRSHLLGLNPQQREQSEFGIGYVVRPGSKFGVYWVVLIARPGDAPPAAAR